MHRAQQLLAHSASSCATSDGGSSSSSSSSRSSSPSQVFTTEAAVVFGAGAGLGSSISTAFARRGLLVLCVRRRHRQQLQELVEAIEAGGGRALAILADARREQDVERVFRVVQQHLDALLRVVVYNIGANVRFDVVNTSARVFRKVWEAACLGGFLVGRQATKIMLQQQKRQQRKDSSSTTILFTGATASLRGKPGFAAFAAAKAGLRSVAQALAREVAKSNIHVCHVVIDGPLEMPWVRENCPEIPQAQMVSPNHVAELFWFLHVQPKRCWTHELDVRTNLEPF